MQQPPKLIDLRPKMPPVYNQGQLSSCSAFAIATAYEFAMMQQNQPTYDPSELFLYYNERFLENKIDQNAGVYVYDGIKAIDQFGVCPEHLWPYIESKYAEKPSEEAYKASKRHKAIRSTSIDLNLTKMQQTLANGFPIIVAIQITEDFENVTFTRQGNIPMPLIGMPNIGGHAVLIVGYDDDWRQLILRNSWGTDWGDKGYFKLPYNYINPLYMDDLWSIEVVV